MEIDGWDCWFNRDIANLHVHWPHFKKNNSTIGELWLGFLRYYTEVFDWDNHVVCIRDTNPLTRKEKNWTKHRLAIEDPFELSHNLAAGVSHKSNSQEFSVFYLSKETNMYLFDPFLRGVI